MCFTSFRQVSELLTTATEVAFVGKAPGTYLMLLGGGYYGQRLNKIYRGLSRFFNIDLSQAQVVSS